MHSSLVELRNEIGMNQAEITKFRLAIAENRGMDWNHIDQAKVINIFYLYLPLPNCTDLSLTCKVVR